MQWTFRANSFAAWAFRAIFGSPSVPPTGVYCEFAAGVAVGPSLAVGAEPLLLADAVACGPSVVFASEPCEFLTAAVTGPEYAEGKPI